ncbi:MAG: heme exporter protein CcmD [Alphaproteobacteria bacterium]|nr:heme exporter protein CcmD [Alphaproteobacteria bacterium]
MNADLADPNWAYVWPAYGLAAIAMISLVAWTMRRQSLWAARAKRLEEDR